MLIGRASSNLTHLISHDALLENGFAGAVQNVFSGAVGNAFSGTVTVENAVFLPTPLIMKEIIILTAMSILNL